MKQVVDHFMELSASERERLIEEHRQKTKWLLQDQKEYALEAARKKAIKENREQGIKQGIKQGREQGIEEGRKQGIEENKKQMALNLLKEKADRDLISRVTGITKEKILKLKSRT